ncbi:hypothetical protein LTR48_007437 [Friedmanniomyces endolithicus]|uniref:Uncharacterized protein n=1 Tax=Rachicladosporium monterosium TaxID=1507873 RepID=A0ABR0KXA0_9PEZI|nr:hypothetical protein LTR48_007437 [Friedmanniomyces endolithicus]KAK5139427.1 hypothetical protein LTR32_007434 [Rachicladosporium monterosium]
MLIQEQAGNGIDAVPYIVIAGRKRDMTLEGCREVEAYEKALKQVIKEIHMHVIAKTDPDV